MGEESKDKVVEIIPLERFRLYFFCFALFFFCLFVFVEMHEFFLTGLRSYRNDLSLWGNIWFGVTVVSCFRKKKATLYKYFW